MASQYHSGEREAQRLAGEQEVAESREGMMQPAIPRQVYRWLAAQTFLAVATADAAGRPWASLVAGAAGFLEADGDGTGLSIRHDLPASALSQLQNDKRVGLLAIDLVSRQRMRINGTADLLPGGLHVQVQEAFFNCPKYITRRVAHPGAAAVVDNTFEGTSLLPAHMDLLRAADVLFLATVHPERGLDVSHRGGDPGFLQMLPDGRIRMPDYPGNSLFNSLGNLLIDPRMAIATPDLRTGNVLQIAGRATVEWHGRDDDDSTGGTHRFVLITPETWRLEAGGPTAGATAELSPFNPHPARSGKP